MGDSKGPVVIVSTGDEIRKALGPPPSPQDAAPAERTSTTEHTLRIGAETVAYQATAGTLTVGLEDPEKPKGRLFYVAYTRKDAAAATRPVTFCFNGGPGSSSVWLHMGCLGPRRVRLDVDQVPPPGTPAEDNDRSVLDLTDLVFVDPMSTGFSRPERGKGEDYHGVAPDVESVGEFVRKWVTRHGRWASPKYVAGESYGTTRAAALARHLQDRHGMHLHGLVLVSVALKFQTLLFDEGNDLPFVLYVPAYAATARYHGRIDGDLDAVIERATTWAFDRYMPALLRGDRLPAGEREAIAQELAAFLGVSTEFVRRCNDRVDLGRFCRELLRDQRMAVGRLDSRFRARVHDAQGERLESDPSMSALMGTYTAAFHHDLKHRLAWDDDEVYEILNLKANQAWKFDRTNRYLDVTADLRAAMTDNPHLRLFVASGLFDLATPFSATDYTLAHLGVEDRVVVHEKYPAGHMMYVHEPSMDRLKADLTRFYG